MAQIINNYDLVKSKNFSLGNSNFYSDNYKTLSIKYNNDNFYIQTPYILNRYCPSNYDSKISLNIPLDFSNITEETIDDISILHKLFIRIHKTIKSRITKNISLDLKYTNCLKKNKKNSKCPLLKTKIHSVDDKMFLKIFKSDKTLSAQQELRPGKEIRFILHLESVWIFKNTFGINWYIIQAEVKLPHIFHSYSFDNEKCDDIISKHNDYKKFFKMVKMGISKDAVKLKMNIEGFDSEIIYMDPNTLSKTIFKQNKEMLLNKPKSSLLTSENSGIKINIMDLSSIKLKKTKQQNSKKLEIIEQDNRIPTQNQLQNQLSKLKKIIK